MNIAEFVARFEAVCPPRRAAQPAWRYAHRLIRRLFDPCPDVTGMISIRKQKLLGLAFSCLSEGECYLEIGTYQGKSLISALLGNPSRAVYAGDNFSQFTATNSYDILRQNLRQYGLEPRVTFHDADVQNVLNQEKIPLPVGLYFYGGPHDEDSQYDAVRLVEPLLADEALGIIDDWRFAEDSQSYANRGTERAIQVSANGWELLYELPARFNGDHALWWNGVVVLAFRRPSRTQPR